MEGKHVWTREELLPIARANPEMLVDIILALQAHIQVLEKRIEALEAGQAKNSRNSSKPPSSDGLAKPDPKSLREKTGRPSGGQDGHPGSALKAVAKPDHAVIHRLKRCPGGCGRSLRNLPVVRSEKRQVFDLPPQKLIVTEHQAEVKRCPCCGREFTAAFPQDVRAPVQYGARIKAWWTYLRVQQLIPLNRASQMNADLFGYRVGEDTIDSAMTTAYERLGGFEDALASLLAKAKLAYADETGLRVAGKLHWLHTLSTDWLTWYGVHKKRGMQAIEAFGILKRFAGKLMHDCWPPYFTLKNCRHVLCNAHILRELVFLDEVVHEKWAKGMRALLLKMLEFAQEQKKLRRRPSPAQILPWVEEYRSLLRQARANSPPAQAAAPHKRGRPKKTKAQNLLDRLERHERSVLGFLYDFNVPFTNNQAEQDLRMMKVQQKISGTFRTLQGAQIFARIRSYASTARKQQRDVFQEMVNVFAAQPFIPTAIAR